MTDAEMRDRLLRKFANHRRSCHCFICRTLTDEDREFLRLNGYTRA